MPTLWRVIVRTVFWSYERGTWPYDIAVAAIVVFVLLSPRSWFRDQPQLGPPSAAALVECRDDDPAGQALTCRVDARLLAPPKRTPELEHDLHEAVRRSVSELKGKSFRILRIEPIRSEDGTLAYYVVSIKP